MKNAIVDLLILIVVILSSMFICSHAMAQDDEDDDNDDDQSAYDYTASSINLLGRDDVAIRLKPLGFGLMGDSIDPFTGTIVFNQTDVSLPGNSKLEVAIRRTASTAQMTNLQEGFFGDWILDVPNISSLSDRHNEGHFRCVEEEDDDLHARAYRPSAYDENGDLIPGGGHQPINIYATSYWDGMKLNIPGQGAKLLMDGFPHSLNPFSNQLWAPFEETVYDPQTQTFNENGLARATKDHWAVTCINPRHNVPGSDYDYTFDGYIAISPNGTRYRMDKMVVTRAKDFKTRNPSDNKIYILKRNIGKYYATEVTDVHGNWVKYDYSPDGKLTRIHSNDGREITLTYVAGNHRISTVTANGRTWTYSYHELSRENSSIVISDALHRVTQPDGHYWEFDLKYQLLGEPDSSYSPGTDGTVRSNFDSYVKHPYGVRADYNVGIVRHDAHSSYNGIGSDTSYNRTVSVFKKILSGASILTSEWEYVYEQFILGGEFSGPTTKTTTMIDPAGLRTVSHFRRPLPSASALEGELLRVERFAPNGTLLEEVNYEYTIGTKMGGNGILEWYGESPANFYNVLKTKAVSKRNGDVFTIEYTFDTDQNSPTYSYGKPLSKSTYSNISTTPRTTVTDYTHRKDKWVLSLVDTITTNGREISNSVYDAFGRVIEKYKYGNKVVTFGYHNNAAYKGALYSIKDAINRTTYLLYYKRGVAKNVRRPDGSQDERLVDDNGWVVSQKDFRGYKTRYDYDTMGRPKRIIPEKNLRAWADTVISYSFGSQNIVQTIQEGLYEEQVTYDQFLRPVLEREKDFGTGWTSYTNTEYDENGRVIFSSFPSTSANETAGTVKSYDALGRLVTSNAAGSLTSYEFLPGHQKRITDPEGNATTYRYTGYEGPDSGELTHIYQPMGVTTFLSRDVHDRINHVRQHGNHNGYAESEYNYYFYDSRYRLCRYRTPEGGDTVYSYDNVNRITWLAKGQPATNSCSQNSVATDQRIVRTYNEFDLITHTDYPDSTPDVTKSYDENGNVLTVNRDGANWTYTYDELEHLKSEKLTIDGRNYLTSYSYNDQGLLSAQTTPANRTVNFYPDAFGRATGARVGGTNYASEITYHPTGQVSNINYGNGFIHSQTLNNRRLPETLHTYKGGTKAVHLVYSYDGNGRVSSVSDLAVSGQNRNFGYDGLGRLTSAYGPWGAGSFIYDPLGNLRQKQLGGRTVDLEYDGNNRLSKARDTEDGSVWQEYAYDARGNITSNGKFNFTYDFANQPTAMSREDGDFLVIMSPSYFPILIPRGGGTHVYDGNYKRVKSVVKGKTTYSVYSLSGKLLHTDKKSENKKTDYIMAAGLTVARIENNSVTYPNNDLLGSPISATSGAGSIQWREHFTPFGEKINNPTANRDNIGFTGHVQDDATGLTYMQARYYDPAIGRFLSIDPVDFVEKMPMTFNRYSYANNNPNNFTDPDGEFVWHAVGALVGGGLNLGAQLIKHNGDFSKVDKTQVLVSAAAGAIGVGVAGSISKTIATEIGLTGTAAVGANVVANSVAGAAIAVEASLVNVILDGEGDPFANFKSDVTTGGLSGGLGSLGGELTTIFATASSLGKLGNAGDINGVGRALADGVSQVTSVIPGVSGGEEENKSSIEEFDETDL